MVNCAQYDYIELSCLFHYRVRITLSSGQVIEGVAVDTEWDSNHQECIKIRLDDSEILVETEKIMRMQAVTENTHFQKIDFE